MTTPLPDPFSQRLLSAACAEPSTGPDILDRVAEAGGLVLSAYHGSKLLKGLVEAGLLRKENLGKGPSGRPYGYVLTRAGEDALDALAEGGKQ